MTIPVTEPKYDDTLPNLMAALRTFAARVAAGTVAPVVDVNSISQSRHTQLPEEPAEIQAPRNR